MTTCNTCAHFKREGGLYNPMGKCHRYPPVTIQRIERVGIDLAYKLSPEFPTVWQDNYCGEYKERPTQQCKQ